MYDETELPGKYSQLLGLTYGKLFKHSITDSKERLEEEFINAKKGSKFLFYTGTANCEVFDEELGDLMLKCMKDKLISISGISSKIISVNDKGYNGLLDLVKEGAILYPSHFYETNTFHWQIFDNGNDRKKWIEEPHVLSKERWGAYVYSNLSHYHDFIIRKCIEDFELEIEAFNLKPTEEGEGLIKLTDEEIRGLHYYLKKTEEHYPLVRCILSKEEIIEVLDKLGIEPK